MSIDLEIGLDYSKRAVNQGVVASASWVSSRTIASEEPSLSAVADVFGKINDASSLTESTPDFSDSAMLLARSVSILGVVVSAAEYQQATHAYQLADAVEDTDAKASALFERAQAADQGLCQTFEGIDRLITAYEQVTDISSPGMDRVGGICGYLADSFSGIFSFFTLISKARSIYDLVIFKRQLAAGVDKEQFLRGQVTMTPKHVKAKYSRLKLNELAVKWAKENWQRQKEEGAKAGEENLRQLNEKQLVFALFKDQHTQDLNPEVEKAVIAQIIKVETSRKCALMKERVGKSLMEQIAGEAVPAEEEVHAALEERIYVSIATCVLSLLSMTLSTISILALSGVVTIIAASPLGWFLLAMTISVTAMWLCLHGKALLESIEEGEKKPLGVSFVVNFFMVICLLVSHFVFKLSGLDLVLSIVLVVCWALLNLACFGYLCSLPHPQRDI